jgi:hypothetical protein
MNQTDICNLALDMLKEMPIGSLQDNRPVARWLARNYDLARDSLMRRYDWNFACRRVELAADATAPVFGWTYQYTLPIDCLRVIPLTHDGSSTGSPVAHEIEAGSILTDAAAPLRVRYVARVENVASYSPEFIQALAARLASGMAHWLTGKNSYAQSITAAFDEAIRTAWSMDAIEGTWPLSAEDEWINAR